ncbi:MAG: Na+/H+ antiporter subunit E, partial [Ignisphaera sp.]
MKRILNKVAVALISMVFYIVFAGTLTELTIATGLVVSIIAAVAFEGMVIRRTFTLRDVTRMAYAVKYLIRFIVAEIIEHIEVAKIIISRRISVNPAVVEVPLDLKSDYAVTAVALTITNTPGTIAVDFDRARGVLYVHWLVAKHK